MFMHKLQTSAAHSAKITTVSLGLPFLDRRAPILLTRGSSTLLDGVINIVKIVCTDAKDKDEHIGERRSGQLAHSIDVI